MRGLIELFVVAIFALGWAVIELVALRYDKKRSQSSEQRESEQARSERRL